MRHPFHWSDLRRIKWSLFTTVNRGKVNPETLKNSLNADWLEQHPVEDGLVWSYTKPNNQTITLICLYDEFWSYTMAQTQEELNPFFDAADVDGVLTFQK